jgi:hypothetical protein
MRAHAKLLTAVASIFIQSAGLCSDDPTAGPEHFPQFRNLSALAGSGFGADSRGYSTLSGPTALSTPVGHVLGHNQFRIAGGKMSFDSSPTLSSSKSNGTFYLMYGATVGSVNIAISPMFLSDRLDKAFNVQAQLIPKEGSHIAFSVGVQDIDGTGGSAGEGFPAEDGRSSRSVFGVATYELPAAKIPVFVSAGIGSRRFRGGFASVSGQVVQPLRIYGEYDGFGLNEGLLLTWKAGKAKKSPEVNAGLGFVRGKYVALLAGLGF